jgi:hypothetical protein
MRALLAVLTHMPQNFIFSLTRYGEVYWSQLHFQCGLTLSQLMLHICRVSKTFGEWYQKTNKTEDINNLTLLAFKIIAILHNYTVGNVHKASGNCQQRPL